MQTVSQTVSFKIGLKFSDRNTMVIEATTDNISYALERWKLALRYQNRWLNKDGPLRKGLAKVSNVRQNRTAELIVLFNGVNVLSGSRYTLKSASLFDEEFMSEAFKAIADEASDIANLPPMERTWIIQEKAETRIISRISKAAYDKKVERAATKKLLDINQQWVEFNEQKFLADVDKKIKSVVK